MKFKVGDFVYIKPIQRFGFIDNLRLKHKAYRIKEINKHKSPWYFYDKHLVLIYEN